MQDIAVIAQPALADVEAEQAVLSVILQDAGAIDRLGDLAPEDFADPVSGSMFAAMQNLRAERLPINTINLRAKANVSPMGRDAIMAQINKLSFAGELPNVTDLSRGIIDLSLRRQLQEAHRRYAVGATDGSQTVSAQLAALRLEIDTIVSRLTRQGKVRLTHKEAVGKMLDELQKDLADVLVPCGIRTVDRSLAGGFRRGDYSILAGRPGAGKSTIALAIALGVAKSGRGVLYFTPEMSPEQLALRAASAAASTKMNPIAYERIMAKDWRSQLEEEQFYRVATNIPSLPIYYDGSTNLLASEMQARVKQAALDMEEAGFKLDMVIVDHMGKVKPTNRYKGNRVQEVGEISEAMATIAKEENVAMLALHQLNRQVESRDNKRPGLSDLRDCLPGDARVLNADTGIEVDLRDIVEKKLRFNVLGIDRQMKLVARPINDAWLVGIKPVMRIITRTGRTLRCTAGHRILTESGWRKIEEISEGDAIAVPRFIPEPRWIPEKGYITEGRALLLGLLLGDGYLGGSPALCISEKDSPGFYVELAKREFCITPSVQRNTRGSKASLVVFSTGRGMSGAKSNPMTRWLRGVGVWGLRGGDKFIPDMVFGSGNKILAQCLRGLFHADGSFSTRAGKQTHIRFTSVSEKLARGVHRGLARLGIVATIKPQKHGGYAGYETKYKQIWLVSITGIAEVRKFLRDVGFVGTKQQSAMARMRGIEEASVKNVTLDCIPLSVNSRVDELRSAAGLSHAGLGWRSQGKRMSRVTCAAIAERLEDPHLAILAQSDLLWDEVVSIESDGVERVFDLTVADVHNFVVNDVVTHNSGHLEQDADVVMFAYREAYYLEQKPEGEGTDAEVERMSRLQMAINDLEILTSKNRRGRTGVMRLYCDVSCNLVLDL